MSEAAKKRAFVHGLAVEPDWTSKFTALFDEKVDLGTPETVTYVNAGTGSHAIALAETLGPKSNVFPVCETPELQEQAQLKANTDNSAVDFSTSVPMKKSEFAIADLSLTSPLDLQDSITEIRSLADDRIAFFLPVAGSFGEVFSYLWEVMSEIDPENQWVEELISRQPTLSTIDAYAEESGLRKVKSHTHTDFVEFENGEAFRDSLLIREVLFPKWTASLNEKERERALKGLARKIDDENDGLSFRMTIKLLAVEASV